MKFNFYRVKALCVKNKEMYLVNHYMILFYTFLLILRSLYCLFPADLS